MELKGAKRGVGSPTIELKRGIDASYIEGSTTGELKHMLGVSAHTVAGELEQSSRPEPSWQGQCL